MIERTDCKRSKNLGFLTRASGVVLLHLMICHFGIRTDSKIVAFLYFISGSALIFIVLLSFCQDVLFPIWKRLKMAEVTRLLGWNLCEYHLYLLMVVLTIGTEKSIWKHVRTDEQIIFLGILIIMVSIASMHELIQTTSIFSTSDDDGSTSSTDQDNGDSNWF